LTEAALALQLAASASTIASTWLYGNKMLWGPRLALLSQVFWWTIMVVYGLWGLLPVNAMMVFIHTRNLRKWKNEC
jgi:hypothetical protein